ncbi:MAG TPA: TonB-dependent receptor, partial [Anseongella sp.]|nr:TonB-dependent receptor [Anseongella sp.]
FGKHNLNVIGGASWYYNRFSSTQAGSQNFFDDYFGFNSLEAGSVMVPPVTNPTGNQMNSFYSRVNYNFDDRFLLGASFRIDGSSRFGSEKKYGNFPSFSAGWNISNEEFFAGLSRTVNNLKLRASYGFVGNAEIGDYVTLPKLNNRQTPFNKQVVSGVVLGSLANSSLTWESSEQLNVGIELGLFNNRVEIIADYYNKVNNDLLYLRVLPVTTGFANVYDNIGDIRNRGFELGVNTLNITNANLRWNTGITFTLNRSKVLDLNGDVLYPWSIRVMEGRPLNEFYGYVREGVWRTDEAEEAAAYGRRPGDVKWKDTNGNGVKDPDDRQVLGNGMPDFELNMSNAISYKGFSLLLDLQSMYGLSLSNTTKHLMQNAATRVNSYEDILNAWTPENQNTLVPALRTAADPGSPSEVADSYAVEDGSFIRVRNIGLTYRLNPEWFNNALIRSLSLGLNV